MFCREALSRNPHFRERIQIIQIRGCLLPSVWRFCSALVNLQILGSLGSALCSDNTTRSTWVTASATQQVLSVPCALSWQGCRDSGAFVLVLGWLRRSRGVVAGGCCAVGHWEQEQRRSRSVFAWAEPCRVDSEPLELHPQCAQREWVISHTKLHFKAQQAED